MRSITASWTIVGVSIAYGVLSLIDRSWGAAHVWLYIIIVGLLFVWRVVEARLVHQHQLRVVRARRERAASPRGTHYSH